MRVPVRGLGPVLAAVTVLAMLASAAGASAQPAPTTGVDAGTLELAIPTVSLDRYEMAPNEQVVVTIDGFRASSVVVSVCGNAARRGSADCNMPASTGRKLTEGAPTRMPFQVAPPPAACPCLVRVASPNQDEVAVAAITLVGHPVAPVEGEPPLASALSISVVAQRAPEGFLDGLKTALGGSARYEVVVTIRNRSIESLSGLTASGSVGRTGTEDLVTFDLSDPGDMGPGSVWEETVVAELPALTFREVQWRATVAGAGPSVTASDITGRSPVLLLLLGIFFVVDIGVLGFRMLNRRRQKHEAERRDDTPPDGGTDAPHEFLVLTG